MTPLATRFKEQILPNLGVAAPDPEIKHIFGGQIGHLVLSHKEFVAAEDDESTTKSVDFNTWNDTESNTVDKDDHADAAVSEFIAALNLKKAVAM